MKRFNISILYQATPPPVDSTGIPKPMKPGGYKDSGADIAYCLQHNGEIVIKQKVEPHQDEDWVFPDTLDGIQSALSKGSNCFWTNTVLFENHPLSQLAKAGILPKDTWIVGQIPKYVEMYDDKWSTNLKLRNLGLQIAPSFLISKSDSTDENTISVAELTEVSIAHRFGVHFPLVVKPIRGRGSEGVVKVENIDQLREESGKLLSETIDINGEHMSKYGNRVIVEQYLNGQEITITVMPPGVYTIEGKEIVHDQYWSLPVVKRFNHVNGIAPYNGVVAVVKNSALLDENELKNPEYQNAMRYCEQAAKIVGAKAPIRVDCREGTDGKFYLFDLNMKPNMTGYGRPGREDQDSLTCIAARGIGWSFTDLLINMLRQAWQATILIK